VLELPAGDHSFIATDVAQVFGELTWVCRRLFEIAGTAASALDDPAGKVALATASRLFGDHAGRVEDIIPDSVLLQPVARIAGGARSVAATQRLALVDPADQVRELLAIVDEVADDLEQVRNRLSPVSDATGLRVTRAVHHDLVELHDMLGAAASANRKRR
jgi:hypothetical protein